MYEEYFLFFSSHSFPLKSIWQNQKSKTEKKRRKCVTTTHWSGTQDSKLRESVSFTNEKEILTKPYFFMTIALCFIHLKQKHSNFFLISGKENWRLFLLITKKKKIFSKLNCIFFGFSFLRGTVFMEDFKSILLDLVKHRNTQ